MTSETLVRDTLAPFGTRLFKNAGSLQITEISEFQAQKWHLGETPIYFQSGIASAVSGEKWGDYFAGIAELFPHVEEGCIAFRRQPTKTPTGRKFSLLVLPLKDREGLAPLGMVSLGLDFTRAEAGGPDWKMNIELEALIAAPHRTNPICDHMMCAAISDLIYDEFRAIDRQTKAMEISRALNIRLTYPTAQPGMKLFAGRLRTEIDTIRHLMNRGKSSPDAPGMKFTMAVSEN
jgi:hypothetical protein